MDTLSQEQIAAALGDLDGWGFEGEALDAHVPLRRLRPRHRLRRAPRRGAEQQHHHPDIDIRYNKVTLRLSSHDAGGVTMRDSVQHLAGDATVHAPWR